MAKEFLRFFKDLFIYVYLIFATHYRKNYARKSIKARFLLAAGWVDWSLSTQPSLVWVINCTGLCGTGY